MNNTNPNKYNIISTAREQLMAEYEKRRELIHRKWEAEADQAWKASRTVVPYPEEMLQFPTDGEIIARAKLIQDFIEQQESVATADAPVEVLEPEVTLNQPVDVPEPEKESVEETKDTIVEKVEDPPPAAEEQKPKSPDWARDPEAIQEYAATMARAKMEDESSTTSRVLPELVKTLEQMRNSLRRS